MPGGIAQRLMSHGLRTGGIDREATEKLISWVMLSSLKAAGAWLVDDEVLEAGVIFIFGIYMQQVPIISNCHSRNCG